MKRLLIAASCAAVSLAACGEEPAPDPSYTIRVQVDDHPDALTASGYDNLCNITLLEAPGAYANIYLEVRVIRVDNGGPVKADMVLNDDNGDGMLDVGESVTATEPIVNFWDATVVGRGMEVRLDFNDGAITTTLAKGTWTPAN